MKHTKPSTIKVFSGEPDKARIKNNPQAGGTPQKPRGMGKEAQKLWDSIVPQLVAMGVVAEVDTANLVALCQHWERYLTLQEALQEEAPGDIRYSRISVALKSNWDTFAKLSTQFGLTPVARNSLDVQQIDSDDEFFS